MNSNPKCHWRELSDPALQHALEKQIAGAMTKRVVS